MTQYGEILRLIPREPKMDVILDLSVEESNAIQWANAYYNQLGSPVTKVDSVKTEDSILSLCEKIQKLVPVIHPDNPTDEFMNLYGNNKEMCRTHNYFNQKIKNLLDHEFTLTRKKTIPVLSMDSDLLDQLAREIYNSS